LEVTCDIRNLQKVIPSKRTSTPIARKRVFVGNAELQKPVEHNQTLAGRVKAGLLGRLRPTTELQQKIGSFAFGRGKPSLPAQIAAHRSRKGREARDANNIVLPVETFKLPRRISSRYFKVPSGDIFDRDRPR
jgi:hypothetical protein